MHDKLKLFLTKINLPEKYYEYFKDGEILKLRLDQTRKNGVFVIKVKNILDDDILDYIDNNINNSFPDMNSIKASFVIENIDYNEIINYYKRAIIKSTLTKPMKELFIEKKVSVNDNILLIELDNIAEENILNNNIDSIINYYNRLGFSKIKIDININKLNNNTYLEEVISNAEVKQKEEKEEDKVLLGNLVNGDITLIKDIIAEESGVTVEAYVFGIEEFESSKSAFKILTFKISDNTDSIYAKYFTKDKDIFKKLSKNMKSGWFRINEIGRAHV